MKGPCIKMAQALNQSYAVQHFPPTPASPPHGTSGQVPQMEGLIPLLYKAIKDRRSGGRAPYPGVGVGLDLYDPEQRRLWLEQEVRSPLHPASAAAAAAAAPQQQHQHQHQHQRGLSLEELAGEVGLSADRRRPRVALPKARSVRVFSCVGAGAAA